MNKPLEKVSVIPSEEALPPENVRPARVRGAAVATIPAQTTPLQIVQAALATGNVEMYREAVALAKEMDAFAARKSFDNAMADAKAKIPTIRKNRLVDASGRDNKGPKYRFEDLAEIARTIDPILSEFGLSYRFRVASPIGQPVTVTCVISHRDGHSEETTLTAGRDDGPGRNAIQQVGSTITYLQRYTLKAALGLAAAHDDDGQRTETAEADVAYTPPAGSISQEQADQIRELLEAKEISRGAFLGWAKQKRIDDIPAEHYDSCITAINNFKKAGK